MARRAIIVLALVAGLVALPLTARAAYIDFANLLGANFQEPSGVSTGHALDTYGLSGYTLDFQALEWYGASTWQAGADPGPGSPAQLKMISYRGEYGLAVGEHAGSGELSGLPGTGVNEIDAREALSLTFNRAVNLSSITLGNFYNDTNSLSGQPERGWAVFDEQYLVPVNFTAPAGQFVNGGTGSYAGTYVVQLPTSMRVTNVQLFADDRDSGAGWSSDYLVRGVDAGAVPEPATGLLVASAAGLAGWLGRRRRRS